MPLPTSPMSRHGTPLLCGFSAGGPTQLGSHLQRAPASLLSAARRAMPLVTVLFCSTMLRTVGRAAEGYRKHDSRAHSSGSEPDNARSTGIGDGHGDGDL